MLKEFKEFAMRGNVLDMAVGVIIGGAFGKIVTSLVNDILMPPLGLLINKVDFANICFDMQQHHFSTLEQAKATGAITINIGTFINTVINFTIVAVAIFLTVQAVQKIRLKAYPPAEVSPPPPPAPPPATKTCSYCCSVIPLRAVRCPQCTANLEPVAGKS
ncbi:MAG: large-conductance mechanosensitive channel protein MscL [Kiritimatiellia bacterium]|nr:large-conductance mechanosensitive channel protein MscL [Kiritimatiellia bacterium]